MDSPKISWEINGQPLSPEKLPEDRLGLVWTLGDHGLKVVWGMLGGCLKLESKKAKLESCLKVYGEIVRELLGNTCN